MQMKWICKECESVNFGEKDDRQVCCVCGRERTTESLLLPGQISPDITPAVPSSPGAPARNRLKEWLRSLFGGKSRISDGGSCPEADEAGEWTISRAPESCREAYLTATPLHRS